MFSQASGGGFSPRKRFKCTGIDKDSGKVCGYEFSFHFDTPHIQCTKCGATVRRTPPPPPPRQARPPKPPKPKKPTIPIKSIPLLVTQSKDLNPFDIGEEVTLPKMGQLTLPSTHDYSPLFWPQDETPSHEAQTLTARFDRLLLWLSMTGKGGIGIFRQACKELGLIEEEAHAGRVMRRLRLLGHIETSRDGAHWMIAPPVLVQTANSNRFFLSGTRDEAIVGEMKQSIEAQVQPHIGGRGPSRVFGSVSDSDQLLDWICKANRLPCELPFSLALWMAERLPSLDEWTQMLESLRHIDADNFELRRYGSDRWNETARATTPGFYEFWPCAEQGAPLPWKVPQARPKYQLLRGTDDTWRRGEWYGLRFAARVAEYGACPAVYHEETAQLAVPYDWRWPEFYERTLVMASGTLPHWGKCEGEMWLIYTDVPPPLLDLVARKLKLNVTHTNARTAC